MRKEKYLPNSVQLFPNANFLKHKFCVQGSMERRKEKNYKSFSHILQVMNRKLVSKLFFAK